MTSWFSALVGGGSDDYNEPASATAVIRVCDRLMHSTLPGDRRAALKTLSALVRDHKKLVVEHGFGALVATLHRNDIYDHEMGTAVVGILVALFDRPLGMPQDESFLATYGKVFLRGGGDSADAPDGSTAAVSDSNISIILFLLRESNIHLRYDCLRLLCALSDIDCDELLEKILCCPSGVMTLVSLLTERSEVLLQETVYFLERVTRRKSQFQKLFAFDNGFDHILGVMETNPDIEVTMDCLKLIRNLLQQDTSTRNLFADAGNVPRLVALLDQCMPNSAPSQPMADEKASPSPVLEWTTPRIAVCQLYLLLFQSLMTPTSMSITPRVQGLCFQAGVLPLFLELSLAAHVPFRIRTIALKTMGDFIRGCNPAQQEFSQSLVYRPYGDTQITQPAMTKIMKCAVVGPEQEYLSANENGELDPNSDDALNYRKAALYCFQCFVYRNEHGKELVGLSSLNPPPDDLDALSQTINSNGHHVLSNSTLLSPIIDWRERDQYRSWFACSILGLVVFRNEKCKEDMISMYNQLKRKEKPPAYKWAGEKNEYDTIDSPEQEEDAVSLVQEISHTLILLARLGNAPERSMVALMTLLFSWIWESPRSVAILIDTETSLVLFLVEQINSLSAGVLVQGLAALLLSALYLFREDPDSELGPACDESTSDSASLVKIWPGQMGLDRKMPEGELQALIEGRIGFQKLESKLTSMREDQRYVNFMGAEFFTEFLGVWISEACQYVLQKVRLSRRERRRRSIMGPGEEMHLNENRRLKERIRELQEALRIQRLSYESEREQLAHEETEHRMQLQQSNDRVGALGALAVKQSRLLGALGRALREVDEGAYGAIVAAESGFGEQEESPIALDDEANPTFERVSVVAASTRSPTRIPEAIKSQDSAPASSTGGNGGSGGDGGDLVGVFDL